jgi:hypothetical protein
LNDCSSYGIKTSIIWLFCWWFCVSIVLFLILSSLGLLRPLLHITILHFVLSVCFYNDAANILKRKFSKVLLASFLCVICHLDCGVICCFHPNFNPEDEDTINVGNASNHLAVYVLSQPIRQQIKSSLKEKGLLCCNVVYFGQSPTFRVMILPPSSGSKINPSKRWVDAGGEFSFSWFLSWPTLDLEDGDNTCLRNVLLYPNYRAL